MIWLELDRAFVHWVSHDTLIDDLLLNAFTDPLCLLKHPLVATVSLVVLRSELLMHSFALKVVVHDIIVSSHCCTKTTLGSYLLRINQTLPDWTVSILDQANFLCLQALILIPKASCPRATCCILLLHELRFLNMRPGWICLQCGWLHHIAMATIRLKLRLHFLIIFNRESLDTQAPQHFVTLCDLKAVEHRWADRLMSVRTAIARQSVRCLSNVLPKHSNEDLIVVTAHSNATKRWLDNRAHVFESVLMMDAHGQVTSWLLTHILRLWRVVSSWIWADRLTIIPCGSRHCPSRHL